MLSIPVRMSPKSTWIALKQALGLCEWCWATSTSQVTVSQCQVRGCQALPAVNNLPTDGKKKKNEGRKPLNEKQQETERRPSCSMKISPVNKCAQFVRQDTVVCLRGMCVCVCARTNGISLCRWTQTKCSGLMETDVGYTAWLSSHYIIRAPSPFFITVSPPTHRPLYSNCWPKLLSSSQF